MTNKYEFPQGLDSAHERYDADSGIVGSAGDIIEHRWPQRGREIANLFAGGAGAWRNVRLLATTVAPHRSIAERDERDPLTTEKGEVAAMATLIVDGATEMFLGLASMYWAHERFPVTRADTPVTRSLLEHCGKLCWLLESVTTTDPFSQSSVDQRRNRIGGLRSELKRGHLDMATESGKIIDMERLHAEGVVRNGERPGTALAASAAVPNFTALAELVERLVQTTLTGRSEDSTAPYMRLSKSAHPTIAGLFFDSKPVANGHDRAFATDLESTEFLALRAALWWRYAVHLCAKYRGLQEFPAFSEFGVEIRRLFPD